MNKDSDSVIRLDMSKEHDNGYFKPESGDKVSIAGNFNSWKEDSLFLEDKDGDFIYEFDLSNITTHGSRFSDTLEFKFKQTSVNNHLIANSGWEAIQNRRLSIQNISKLKANPLQFNEPWQPGDLYQVTFTVGMSNQEVLGFFTPEEQDQVVVSGNFMNWNNNGILMADEDGDKIYSVTVPIKLIPEKNLEFKFRIIPKQKHPLMNSGWETIPNRIFDFTVFQKNSHPEDLKGFAQKNEQLELPYCDFSDMCRVARFIVDTEKWEKEGKFKPLKGDILQIKTSIDGKEFLSSPLIMIGKKKWETALQIPANARSVNFYIIENTKIVLRDAIESEVSLKGQIIRF